MNRIFCSRNRSNFAVGKFYFYEPFGHLHRIIYKMITKGGSDIKKFDDIKKMLLSGKELEAVTGGAENSEYHLYYNGKPLPMYNTVAEICALPEFPDLHIKEKLNGYYNIVAHLNLNQLCGMFGENTIQSLINNS